MKQQPNTCFINKHWATNLDIQPLLDFYKDVCKIYTFIKKSEDGTWETMKNVTI